MTFPLLVCPVSAHACLFTWILRAEMFVLAGAPKVIDPQAVLAEVKDKDWREDLKHVEPHKDASAPVIERM